MSSSLVKSLKFHYLNNRETGNFFFSDDEDNDFNFKYVPTNQFKYIVNDVKRQRTKQDEERIWTSFVQQQEQKYSDDCRVNCFHGITNPRQNYRDNLEEIDQELRRLEEDALPEQTKRLNDCETLRIINNEKQKDNLVHKTREKSPSEYDDSGKPLLEIQEESHRQSKFERSQLNLITKTNKSRYERTIKHQHDRSHLQMLNCRECSSNPELSSPNDSDNYHELREFQPHPIVANKILGIQSRISELLDEILYRLCRIPQPDGDIDLKRRQQRAMEFAIRFSRNYLYELGRQVVNLQRHLQAISPNARIKPTKRGTLLHMQALERKLCSTHQLLFNALSAYCKHIPSSILKGHPGKLKEILQIVIDIKDICSKINLTAEHFGAGDTAPPPLGNDTQKRCYAILSKLRLNSDNESPLFSHSTQSTLIGVSATADRKRRSNQVDNRKFLPNRFSMYSVDSRYNKYQRNRRPVTVGVYLKERKSLVERLPLTIPLPTPDQTHPNFATLKAEKNLIKRSRIRSRAYQKEDEIRTIMESMPTDSETGSTGLLLRKCQSSISNGSKIMRRHSSKQWQRERNSRPTTKSSKQTPILVSDNNKSKKDVKITDEHLSSLIPVISDIMTLIANKNNSEVDTSSTSLETFLEGFHEYLMNKNKENSNQPVATLRGKPQEHFDRNSIELPKESEIKPINVPSQEERDSLILNHSEIIIQNQPDNSRYVESKCSKLTQLSVSEASAEELLNYRNELSNYQRTCRSSPMYTSDSPNKPWEVIAWIADKLVDELMIELCKELQMDDVIQKLFDLEFQEF
ncbi:hypothetical protein PV327_007671 [Microctonus hyperodae]|uniref:Uncharacterized protein n=1 Tax=Microctonus hyperodae TaxID=165561 RepID=A0AA39KYQ4_MICHY|nr:hypothetical protein PV327_007671 [Microctonus hyperodae]